MIIAAGAGERKILVQKVENICMYVYDNSL